MVTRVQRVLGQEVALERLFRFEGRRSLTQFESGMDETDNPGRMCRSFHVLDRCVIYRS